MIHATRRTARGFVPVTSSSSELSTTARIAVPTRVTRRNTYNTIAAATDTPTMIIWSLPTYTPAIRTVSPGIGGT